MKFEKDKLRYDRIILDFDALVLYQKMEEEGQLPVVFFGAHIDVKHAIEYFVRHSNAYLVYYKDKLVCAYWLENIAGKTADIHFTAFKDSHLHCIDIGKDILSHACKSHGLRLLKGCTPTEYVSSCKLYSRIGLQTIFKGSKLLYNGVSGQYMDATYTIYEHNGE